MSTLVEPGYYPDRRGPASLERIRRFMRALGRSADADGACFLTGGATAVLLGWRSSTIDVDVRLVPPCRSTIRFHR